MKSTDTIGIVILAAGASTRLGKPKQLLKFRNTSLLQHVIDIASEIDSSQRILVLGANSDRILKSIDIKKFTVAINANWSEGIAGSIRTGVEKTLELNPAVDHLLFLLSDQPFISAELIRSLIRRHLQGKDLTASHYKETLGVPALFPGRFSPI